jgi:ornithine cyclodeaminase
MGAGAQAVTQAAAVCAARDIQEIRVFDLSQTMLNSFAERLSQWNVDAAGTVRIASSAREAVENADVICTATTATQPVFEDAWLKPGVHINGIGAYTPEMQEIPDATMARALIVVDAVDAALHEAGDLIQAIGRGAIAQDAVKAELGSIASGKTPGRSSADQVTFFKSVGNAIQDMIVAGVAIHEAEAVGVGQDVQLG